VTNVVFMGTGEPLANYDATLAAVRAMIDPRRLGISARRVTVSTVGLPKQIRRLADEDLPITLAISLHAASDSLRQRLMPKAARVPLKETIAAARAFFGSHKREVTLEYVLLAGLNDTPQCAEDLADVAHSLRCNVNLIRYNPVTSLPDRRPGESAVADFAAWLRRRGVNVNVRRPRGLDVEAACGQLRKRNSRPN
jgi:23S rRNA (adenine2503-C2)-methyltransferase